MKLKENNWFLWYTGFMDILNEIRGCVAPGRLLMQLVLQLCPEEFKYHNILISYTIDEDIL